MLELKGLLRPCRFRIYNAVMATSTVLGRYSPVRRSRRQRDGKVPREVLVRRVLAPQGGRLEKLPRGLLVQVPSLERLQVAALPAFLRVRLSRNSPHRATPEEAETKHGRQLSYD